MRYLDLTSLSPYSSEAEVLKYASAIGVRYDSTQLPEQWLIGDVLITGPWGSKEWAWLPKWVQIEIVPDGGIVKKREDTLVSLLKQHGLPSAWARKAPSTPRPPKDTKGAKTPYETRLRKYEDSVRRVELYHELLEQAGRNADSVDLNVAIQQDYSAAPYELVTDPSRAVEVINSLHGKRFAYDYETTSRNPREASIVGVALADERDSWYIAGGGLSSLSELGGLLTDRLSVPIASNVKYEYEVTKTNLGIDPMDMTPALDTQVMNWVLTNGYTNDLKSLARSLLKRDVLAFNDIVPEGTDIRSVPLELIARYAAAGDARNSYDAAGVLEQHLREEGLSEIYYGTELALTPVLAEMELTGFRVDRTRLAELLVQFTKERDEHAGVLAALGFSGRLSSDEEVAHWLFDELGVPVFKTTQTGRGSLDKTALTKSRLAVMNGEAADPRALLALREFGAWGKAEKLVDTFLLPVYDSGVEQLFFKLQQTSTATGRLSSADPNVQNWPMVVRDMIVPPEGYNLVARDYNQIEPRIAALLSGDPFMTEVYAMTGVEHDCGPHGGCFKCDPYMSLGLAMGFDEEKLLNKEKKTRVTVKADFLGWLYGAGVVKMQETAAKDEVYLPLAHVREAAQNLEVNRPVLMAWKRAEIDKARRTGESWTLDSRRRLVPKVWSNDPQERGEGEREAVNETCQGFAAGIIKRAMPKVHQLLKQAGAGGLINQIHDEIVSWEKGGSKESLDREIERVMVENEYGLTLKVESGRSSKSWLEAKPS